MEKERDLQELVVKAESGDVEAMVTAAKIYKKRGDDAKSQEYMLRAAQKGHAGAEFAVGMEYFFGLAGREQRAAEGIRYLRDSAEKNFAQAQFTLATVYEGNLEARKYIDEKTAMKYLEKAAEQGNVNAQDMLGEKYFKGEGVERSLDKAVFWWCCACLHEDASTYARKQLNDLLRWNRWSGLTKIKVQEIMDDIKANYSQYTRKAH